MHNNKVPNTLLIYSVFILSGIAGLIYESVWSQYLGLLIGHAAFAQTLTLAIFMGGMALGSFLVSRFTNKISNALLMYASIELILGLLGLFFHDTFTWVINYSFNVLFPSLHTTWIVNVAKWSIATLLILPQSILLGATFPLISTGLIRRINKFEGSIIASLYFSNSIGASFGAILSTFILIPAMGMPGAIMTAAFLNIIVAFVIYLPAKKHEEKYTVHLISTPENNTNQANLFSTRIFLIIAALTGLASFIYEITWIRMLNLVFGTTLHSFEIMLSSFILGLALGGLWIKKRIDNINNIIRYLGFIQIIMGALAVLTMPLYMESFSWLSDILRLVLIKSSLGYTFYNIFTAVFAILIMLPAAFCAGMTLPLLSTALLKKGEGEQAIGKIYSANTIGGLLGVWFAIHIGMIYFGLKNMLIFASLIDALLGIYLLHISRGNNKSFIKFNYISTFVYLVIVTGIYLLVEFSPRILSSGTYRNALSTINSNTNILFYKDGKSATISVLSSTFQNNKAINQTKAVEESSITSDLTIIATNGKPDAGVMLNLKPGNLPSQDEPTMVLLGTIPLLIKPDAKSIANIGFGSGITSHVLLASKKIQQLDTIEIEPAIIEGSRFFLERNYRAYDDPRSNIIIDDAKTYFASNNKKYDIIVSEPSNPWVMGVGNLFSKEFYSNIKRYMKKDTLLIQWLQLYEISPQVISTAFNALASEFEYFEVYTSNNSDLIIVTSESKIPPFKFRNLQQYDQKIVEELNHVLITNLESIRSRKIGTQEFLKSYFRSFSTAVNSDYFPEISLKAPKDRYMKIHSDNLFAYTSFNVPTFELLNTQSDINFLIDSEDTDDYNPFTNLEGSLNLSNFISNSKFNQELNYQQIGLLQTFSQANELCRDKISSIKWLLAFGQLYDGINTLGFEKMRLVTDSINVKTCLSLTQSKAVSNYLTVMKLFSNEEFSKLLNFVLNNNGLDYYSRNIFKTSIVNKALFSAIILKRQNTKLNYKLLKELRSTIKGDTTTNWLESFLFER